MAYYDDATRLLTVDDEPLTIPYEPPVLGLLAPEAAPEATPRTTFMPDRRASRSVRGRGRGRAMESGELPTLRRPRSAKKAVDSVWHIILAAFFSGLVFGVFVMASLHPR